MKKTITENIIKIIYQYCSLKKSDIAINATVGQGKATFAVANNGVN
jgi:hypothetical protein